MTSSRLAHAADPWTSENAAIQLDASAKLALKLAIITLLDEHPRTADETTRAYVSNAEVNRWPLLVDLHNVKRRMSELHTLHRVTRKSGVTRPSAMGRPTVVWELAVPAVEARTIVAIGGMA